MTITNPHKWLSLNKLLVGLVFFIALTACQATAIYTNNPTQTSKQNGISKQTHVANHQPRQQTKLHSSESSEYMIASWYGRQYHGKKTANGETYNMYDYTAAHRTLPFGTRLKLINEENNKEAIVRINDRGPVPLERDIDVSYKTAQTLDFVNAGICKLKVIHLD